MLKLPLPPMLMLIELQRLKRMSDQYNKGFIKAELDIKNNLWFFDCHFPGNPIMPGCLGLDGLWQLTGLTLAGAAGRGAAMRLGW